MKLITEDVAIPFELDMAWIFLMSLSLIPSA